MSFKIMTKAIGGRLDVLVFKGVKDYKVKDGFVIFIDIKTGVEKRFAVCNTSIEVE